MTNFSALVMVALGDCSWTRTRMRAPRRHPRVRAPRRRTCVSTCDQSRSNSLGCLSTCGRMRSSGKGGRSTGDRNGSSSKVTGAGEGMRLRRSNGSGRRLLETTRVSPTQFARFLRVSILAWTRFREVEIISLFSTLFLH
jgi:hypothetical protein